MIAWANRQDSPELWTTSVTVFEVHHGLARLPAGRKRAALEQAFGDMLRENFEGRVVAFDQSAADAAGRLAVRREARGQTPDIVTR